MTRFASSAFRSATAALVLLAACPIAAAGPPNDPHYPKQWYLYEETGGMRALQAWDRATGAGVVVAIVDTGSTSHPDLNAQVLPGYDFITDPRSAGDNNGRDSDPTDMGDASDSPPPCPHWWCDSNPVNSVVNSSVSSWHGTSVAGVIAATTNNATGIAGIAPQARLVHVRVAGRNRDGFLADLQDGITWASGGNVAGVPANANPAEVINISLGRRVGFERVCPGTLQTMINAAVARGSTIVVSAGNDSVNAATQYPANCANVITVGSTDRNGQRRNSNYGSVVDISAPGGGDGESGVYTTSNDGPVFIRSPNYQYFGATSAASAQVSGVVALMQSAGSPRSPAVIEGLLKCSARPFPTPCPDCGTGILNADRAVRAAMDNACAVTGGPSQPTPVP